MTQVGRAMRQLGIEMIPAYSPDARDRSERMFGTLQNRLPQELRIHGITDMADANRFLREKFLPAHNARFAQAAEYEENAFTPLYDFPLGNDVLPMSVNVTCYRQTVCAGRAEAGERQGAC